MKTVINLKAKLPQLSPDEQIKVAFSRIELIVKGGARLYSNNKQYVTYTGTTDKNLILEIQQILGKLINDQLLAIDNKLSDKYALDSAIPDVPTIGQITNYALFQAGSKSTNGEEPIVLAVRQFKFGKSPVMGYVLTLAQRQIPPKGTV